jgi:quercetin dioxygenase-like cupin family protein
METCYSGMVTRRTLLSSLGVLAMLADAARAQPAAPGTRAVFQHDLPDINLSGWSATAVEVRYGPGESSPPHRHPGITIAYVLEGAIRSRVGGDPEQTYTAGQMFIETPDQLHAVSRNASSSQPARLLAILLAKKRAALTVPAQP